MTLNGVLAVILRYFSEFGYLPGILRKSSRWLSHLLMNLECRSEMCYMRLGGNTGRKHRHLGTIAQLFGLYLRNYGTHRQSENKNSSGDEIANVNFYAVRPQATRIR